VTPPLPTDGGSRVAGDVTVAVGAIAGYLSAFWLVPLIIPAALVVVGALIDATAEVRRRTVVA
jgi:hypothetical protein